MIHTKKYIEKKNSLLQSKTKVCIQCKIKKDKIFFTTDNKHADKKHPICNDCKKENQRLLYNKQPERFYLTAKRWQNRNPQKRKAHEMVNRAIASGALLKPSRCQLCGKGGRIEGHHWHGYEDEYALDVQWLCHPCHEKEDAKIRI